MKKIFNKAKLKEKNKESKTENIEKKYIVKNSMLDKIYNFREEDLISLDKEDEENLEAVLVERSLVNQEIESTLNNIVNDILIEDLKKVIQKKMTVEYKFNSYYNEKFYKAGFSDGVKTIVESVNL